MLIVYSLRFKHTQRSTRLSPTYRLPSITCLPRSTCSVDTKLFYSCTYDALEIFQLSGPSHSTCRKKPTSALLIEASATCITPLRFFQLLSSPLSWSLLPTLILIILNVARYKDRIIMKVLWKWQLCEQKYNLLWNWHKPKKNVYRFTLGHIPFLYFAVCCNSYEINTIVL